MDFHGATVYSLQSTITRNLKPVTQTQLSTLNFELETLNFEPET